MTTLMTAAKETSTIKRESILPLNRQFTAFCLIEPGIDASTIPLSKRKRFSAK